MGFPPAPLASVAGTRLALLRSVRESSEPWEGERRELLARRISDMGLTTRGTVVERLADQLYSELSARGLAFHPPVYLSDQWGCPEGTPLIGVPFYLADPRLSRIEEEMAVEVEGEPDAMRFMRHEAGHAFNYAYRLYEREDWRAAFGSYHTPYRERYEVNPFSRAYVRHILGWYAQKHPDEDFAETFAVWLTPGLDWRRLYEGWPALRKLEYVDRVMAEVAEVVPEVPALSADDLPVDAMDYTVADHYADAETPLPLEDERQLDAELMTIFGTEADAPGGELAAKFLRTHRREMVTRMAYWTGEPATTVRALIDHLALRAEALGLRVRGLDAATLVELTAFGTAVLMNLRYTAGRSRRAPAT